MGEVHDFLNNIYYDLDINELEKIGELGSGGFGNVIEYKHRESNFNFAIKFVAIKIENHCQKKILEDNKRLFNEITNHFRLQKLPNLIDFYGFGILQNRLLFYLERMDTTLTYVYKEFHRIKEHFPEKLLFCVLLATLNGIEQCKAKNIMHRDIKPDNILINWSGEVKLCDFGISRIVEESKASTNIGTYAYWPPERCRISLEEKFEYDSKSDIWSLGITYLEIICGDLPYKIYAEQKCADLIGLLDTIDKIDSDLMIRKCFSKEQYYPNFHFDRSLIRECLEEKPGNRPKIEAIKRKLLLKCLNYYKITEDSITRQILSELKSIRSDKNLLTHERRNDSSDDKLSSISSSILQIESVNAEITNNHESGLIESDTEELLGRSHYNNHNDNDIHRSSLTCCLYNKKFFIGITIFITIITTIVCICFAVWKFLYIAKIPITTTTTTFSTQSTTSNGPYGCDANWFYFKGTGFCYQVKQLPKASWNDANNTCQVLNAHLVSIHSRDELEFLTQLAESTKVIAIGLWSKSSTRDWTSSYSWTDRTKTSWCGESPPWGINEPPNDSTLRCVYMFDGKWYTNYKCDAKEDNLNFICKTFSHPI